MGSLFHDWIDFWWGSIFTRVSRKGSLILEREGINISCIAMNMALLLFGRDICKQFYKVLILRN